MKHSPCTILVFLIFITCSLYGQAQIRIACIGNSITAGFGLEHPEQDAYPAVLGKLLDSKYPNTFEVRNFGVSARTLLSKGDMPWVNEPAFTDVLNYMPHYVFIKLGTNDTKPHNWQYKDEFRMDLGTLISRIQDADTLRPQIILCAPIPVYQNNWGIRDEILVNEIIPIIQSVAKDNNLLFIDLHTNMANNLYLDDNVHPNIEGSSVIAQKIFDAVFANMQVEVTNENK